MAKLGMAIDLDKCVGCGACGMACKTENNTEHQIGGTTYNWADFLALTVGTFPNTKYRVIPTLCNHCTDAPCVTACPVTPDKAMFKTADGVTMHNDSRCIGCKACVTACPYSSIDVVAANKQYSVIHYNPSSTSTHTFWAGTSAIIANGTSTPAEVATAATFVPPYKNDYTHTDYNSVRPSNVTEKCYLCKHRTLLAEEPYCVVSCPTGARIYGDLNDGSSAISLAIADGYRRLADNSGAWLSGAGTDPNVYYKGEYNPVNVEAIAKKPELKKLLLYPNPASYITTAEFDLEFSNPITIILYNISGKEVRRVLQNENRPLGKNTVKINVNGLSAGTYICVVRSSKEIYSSNLVVTK